MKKLLLSIVLVLCILISMTSCDAVLDMIPEDIKDAISEVLPGVLEEPDVPEDNIKAIVNKINSNVSIASLMNEQEILDTQNISEDIKEELGKICGDVNLTLNTGSDVMRVYAAIKDNVLFLSYDGQDVYIFIEDDMLLTEVSGSASEGYTGSVTDEIKNALESAENGESGAITESDEQALEFIESLSNVTLPYASENDIIYRDEKYYLSSEYLENTTTVLAREILARYYEIYPESTPDDIYDNLEENISNTIRKLNIDIWFNAKCEEITGFGYSFYGEGDDLTELSEDLDEIEKIRFFYDANGGLLNMELYCEGEEEYETLSIKLTNDTTYDENGEIATSKIDFDMRVPYSNGEYLDSYDEYISLRGEYNVTFDLEYDSSKRQQGGNVLTVRFNNVVSGIKAYRTDYYSYDQEEIFSSELTEMYASRTDEERFEFTIDSENGGDRMVAMMSYNQTNSITYNSTTTYSMRADITTSADRLSSIPQAVQAARDEALEEYYEYNDYN